MKNEIVKFDTPELQSIEKSKAEQIKTTFEPMAEMLTEFEEAYNLVISDAEKEITREVTAKAKRLRLDIGKVRIETEKIRKEQKEEYLRAGKAIDGVSNILKWAVTDKENKLKDIENYFEIQEQKRLEKLQADRAEKLSLYVEDAHERDLAKFADDEFEALLAMKKKEQEDRIAAEKKAEAERLENERLDRLEQQRILEVSPYGQFLDKSTPELRLMSDEDYLELIQGLKNKKSEYDAEQERIRLENERLRKEAEAKEKKLKERNEKLRPYIVYIRDYDKVLGLSDADFEKELKELNRAAMEQMKFEAEQKRKKQEEIEKHAKLEAELKAKIEAERKAKEEEEARLQAELNKGDADKVKDLIADLKALKTKYSFKSAKNTKMYADVNLLIDKVINHIEK